MTYNMTIHDFSALLTATDALSLMNELKSYIQSYDSPSILTDIHSLCDKGLMIYEWSEAKEEKSVDALIDLFNTLFASQNVILMHSDGEPEYFAATYDKPARIAFAHGFFASALHEISHWCIAGQARRRLDDFGYWYSADGRNQDEQLAFERVEIKPQALECLFSLACHRPFRVSQDNIFATFDTSSSTFAADVYKQALNYKKNPELLPRDAKILLLALLHIQLNSQAA